MKNLLLILIFAGVILIGGCKSNIETKSATTYRCTTDGSHVSDLNNCPPPIYDENLCINTEGTWHDGICECPQRLDAFWTNGFGCNFMVYGS